MLATAVLVLAATTGVGGVPVPDAVRRFPDSTYWPGVGLQQVGNMLAEVASSTGTSMMSVGPGPSQLMARWQAGQLSVDQRVAVLLGGAAFHDPVLLPAYAAASRSTASRERQAAAVGLAFLLGDAPPAPLAIPDTTENWEGFGRFAEALAEAARTRSLVGIWRDSYAAAIGAPHVPGLVLRRSTDACLRAIRAIAQPGDLNELLALWPLVRGLPEQAHLLRSIEMVTVQRFVEVPRGERAASGDWLLKAGVERMRSWVDGVCRTLDGEGVFLNGVASAGGGDPAVEARPYLKVLAIRYPYVWPVAAERLTAFGGPALWLDREGVGNPANKAQIDQFWTIFPLSAK